MCHPPPRVAPAELISVVFFWSAVGHFPQGRHVCGRRFCTAARRVLPPPSPARGAVMSCLALSFLPLPYLVGGSVDTAALSSKLVELAALLADRDSKVAELNEFVKKR